MWVSACPVLHIPSCEGVRYPWEESQDGSSPGGRKPLTHPGLKSGFSDPVAGLSGFLPPFFICNF